MPVDARIQAALNGPHGCGRELVAAIRPKKGYAAAPGSGPHDERCGTCFHLCGVPRNEFGCACSIAERDHFGAKIYISPASPACSRWEPRS